jgi:hypothetical protein
MGRKGELNIVGEESYVTKTQKREKGVLRF